MLLCEQRLLLQAEDGRLAKPRNHRHRPKQIVQFRQMLNREEAKETNDDDEKEASRRRNLIGLIVLSPGKHL